VEKNRRWEYEDMDGQANNYMDQPPLDDDSEFRRKVYAARKRVLRVKCNDYMDWLNESRQSYEKEIRLQKLTRQAWNSHNLASGVYKIYDDSDRYKCTGTLVADRMFVVLHALSEDLGKNYKAVNHQHSLILKASTLKIHNDEIASFKHSGTPTPFNSKKLKVMTTSQIVTVFGYGEGSYDQPDSITGFASPIGWCNAATRNGDCTSPVLDKDGNIVGFWTHGNGIDFGRFEPVTQDLINFVQGRTPVTHAGLDFQSRPHFQAL